MKTAATGVQISRQTITASVIKILREKIISHEIKGGQPLRQDALAEELDVSRIPIREALLQLEAEGLVRFAPHKGAVATEISVSEVDELFGIRLLLECDILSKALSKITDEELDKSEAILAEFDLMLKPGTDVHSWGALNWQYHKSLYQPSQLTRTISILGQLHINSERYLRLQIQLTADYPRAEQEHHDLLMFCRKRDKRGANKCLKNHILTTKKELIRVLKAHHS